MGELIREDVVAILEPHGRRRVVPHLRAHEDPEEIRRLLTRERLWRGDCACHG
jgi:hypothetical protein